MTFRATSKVATETVTCGAFLDEAAHPDVVLPGAIVVTGDEEAPVVARVVDIVERPGGHKVVMALVGTADELAEALDRVRTTAA